MEKAIINGGTRSIQLNNVKLLVEASGTYMAALHPGGGVLSPLFTPLALKRIFLIRS